MNTMINVSLKEESAESATATTEVIVVVSSREQEPTSTPETVWYTRLNLVITIGGLLALFVSLL